jgi:DNA sulfur modification protein DndB
MNKSLLLPAIRSYVGDWIFYTTTLSFNEVVAFVKSPDEVHERQKLSDWIQREAIDEHSDAISEYIIENEQRFLGALIIGVYDGCPNWVPLNVSFLPEHLDLSESQKEKVEGRLGLLHLTGTEKLFAIDGQHRVAGIKNAIEEVDEDSDILDDSVSAIFVSHDASTEQGKQRTRRLFTTLNKKAKPISQSAVIALDEDNGFAIVTRKLIDSHWLFEDNRNHISYTSTGSIPADDESTITSVVGLYIIIKDLHQPKGKKFFESRRPAENKLEEYFHFSMNYIDTLLNLVQEYDEVFRKRERKANYYRVGSRNHMLFRPVGQRAFARAVQLLMSRGHPMHESIDLLSKVNLFIDSDDWHHILWDPIGNSMITNKVAMAETQLLSLAGMKARSNRNQEQLQDLLASL